MKEKDAKEAAKEPVGELLETLDDIMSVDGTDYVTVRGWGGRPVKFGSLTAGQMITFLENNDNPANKRRNGLMLITMSLCKKDGTRIVNPDVKEDVDASIEKLKHKDSKTNGELVDAILELNGMNKKDAAAIAKNVSSEAVPGASPTS